jgi:DNA-binding response OmpR family regulator
LARILIVDDEPLIALLAQDWLADLGHQTLGPAHDLDSALDLADQPMDAAILDVSLGANESWEVARRLRARAIPLAFATGHAPEMSDASFADAATLAKPYSFEAFRDVVARLLQSDGAPDA